jgi:tetratricopeptide (TPR) repeat protein
LEKSLFYCEGIQNQEARIAALNNLALVHSEIGERQKAIDYTKSALESCEQIGDRHRSAALYNHLADLYQHAGEHEAAMEYLKEAVKIFGEIEHRSTDPRPQIWMLIEW